MPSNDTEAKLIEESEGVTMPWFKDLRIEKEIDETTKIINQKKKFRLNENNLTEIFAFYKVLFLFFCVCFWKNVSQLKLCYIPWNFVQSQQIAKLARVQHVKGKMSEKDTATDMYDDNLDKFFPNEITAPPHVTKLGTDTPKYISTEYIDEMMVQ